MMRARGRAAKARRKGPTTSTHRPQTPKVRANQKVGIAKRKRRALLRSVEAEAPPGISSALTDDIPKG